MECQYHLGDYCWIFLRKLPNLRPSSWSYTKFWFPLGFDGSICRGFPSPEVGILLPGSLNLLSCSFAGRQTEMIWTKGPKGLPLPNGSPLHPQPPQVEISFSSRTHPLPVCIRIRCGYGLSCPKFPYHLLHFFPGRETSTLFRGNGIPGGRPWKRGQPLSYTPDELGCLTL